MTGTDDDPDTFGYIIHESTDDDDDIPSHDVIAYSPLIGSAVAGLATDLAYRKITGR